MINLRSFLKIFVLNCFTVTLFVFSSLLSSHQHVKGGHDSWESVSEDQSRDTRDEGGCKEPAIDDKNPPSLFLRDKLWNLLLWNQTLTFKVYKVV